MNDLQKMFDEAIDNRIAEIQRDVVLRSFRKYGIKLTQKQLRKILTQSERETFSIDLDDSQIPSEKTEDIKTNGIKIEFSDEEADRLTEQFSSALERLIPSLVDKSAAVMLKDFDRRFKKEGPRIRSERAEFDNRIRKHWAKAFELLELYIKICVEAGDGFNRHYRPLAAVNNDFVFDVLTRLHARGCQVALEVLTLLEAGFADGAHARWRTLHEIACVGFFIKSHGQEVAERYLLHDLFEMNKAAGQYQRWHKELGYRPFGKRMRENLQTSLDAAKSRFGKAFASDYGWAAEVFGKDKVWFADIEKDIGLEKYRPLYRWASNNVHAGSRGIATKLGLPDRNSKILLAGKSDAGLADPGHGAAISLFQITTALLLSQPTIDGLSMCAVLTDLQRRIGNEFLKGHDLLLQRTRKRQASAAKTKSVPRGMAKKK